MRMTSAVKFSSFSKKQLRVLNWWLKENTYDGIICDGAVRSGKTLCMAVSFITWASFTFDGVSFAVCGKTIASVRRNITSPVLPLLAGMGFEIRETISRNVIEISAFGHTNRFYLFGGRDESSASLIQGMTLNGIMLDEVALMPGSFADQAVARCSPEGAKLWFNCNPENPAHWFYKEWIKKADEKNCLYIHFEMTDNPSLTPAVLARYERLYTGVFRERYILGRWVAARGSVYPMFSEKENVGEPPGETECCYISCDYGTVNPASFGLWEKCEDKWYRTDEYYYDSGKTGERRTDTEHLRALKELAGGKRIEAVIVDPSAASFIECIERDGTFRAVQGKNDVIDGIRRVQDCLREGRIFISPRCADTIREFSLYRWKENSAGDAVIKENDHAMDDIRYFVSTVVMADGEPFFVQAISR